MTTILFTYINIYVYIDIDINKDCAIYFMLDWIYINFRHQMGDQIIYQLITHGDCHLDPNGQYRHKRHICNIKQK